MTDDPTPPAPTERPQPIASEQPSGVATAQEIQNALDQTRPVEQNLLPEIRSMVPPSKGS